MLMPSPLRFTQMFGRPARHAGQLPQVLERMHDDPLALAVALDLLAHRRDHPAELVPHHDRRLAAAGRAHKAVDIRAAHANRLHRDNDIGRPRSGRLELA